MITPDEIIKQTLLTTLNKEQSYRTVGEIINIYEKRYGKKIVHWNKLKSDIKYILSSDDKSKQFVSREIINLTLKNGINHIYISQEDVPKQFRKILLKEKQKRFLNQVYDTFN